jgi:hypothetical protein
MENGDKFFTKASLVAQSSGDGKLANFTAGVITGGTGLLAKMHGIIRTSGTAEPKAGLNDNSNDIEYWIDYF